MLGLGNSIVKSPVVDSWTPAKLGSKLQVWYRFNTGLTSGDATADDGSTVAEQVKRWADQSGNNNDGTPVDVNDAEETPTYIATGRVRFEQGNESLVFSSALNLGSFAIWFRANWSDTLSNDVPFEGDSNNFIKLTSPTEMRVKFGGDTREDSTIPEIRDDGTEAVNIGIERNSSGGLFSYVGSAAGEWSTSGSKDGESAISNVFALTQIGDGTHNSTWDEVVICNDVLTSDERTKLLEYLDKIV